MISRCKKCNKEIFWLTTKNNKKMPFNLKETQIAVKTKDQHIEIQAGYVNHWTTCPYANDFKKR